MSKKDKKKFNDLGLGTKTQPANFRSLNKDGTFNVKKINTPFLERINFYHTLISMSWPRFFVFVFIGYLIVNVLFACLYMAIGVEHLTGIDGSTPVQQFTESFFFSAQTVTTLGYGRVAPVGFIANIVAAFESMIGLLTFALATGLLYGRFSKPNTKIRYSTNAIIAPYQNINGFMIRVANPQSNQLIEVEAQITLSLKADSVRGRSFFMLDLERSSVSYFPYMWTIVHPIDENSPLYGLSEKDVIDNDAEFIISLKAFDESFSQTIYSRSSYKPNELKWGQKFVYAIQREAGQVIVDISRIDETETMPLN